MFNTNSTSFVLIKSISLDENEFIVWIKFYSVSIYVYNNVEKNLSRLQGLFNFINKDKIVKGY